MKSTVVSKRAPDRRKVIGITLNSLLGPCARREAQEAGRTMGEDMDSVQASPIPKSRGNLRRGTIFTVEQYRDDARTDGRANRLVVENGTIDEKHRAAVRMASVMARGFGHRDIARLSRLVTKHVPPRCLALRSARTLRLLLYSRFYIVRLFLSKPIV